jgi:hypothetical protein
VESSGGHRGGVVAHGSILPNAEERERERGADDRGADDRDADERGADERGAEERDVDERVAANDGRDSTYAPGK